MATISSTTPFSSVQSQGYPWQPSPAPLRSVQFSHKGTHGNHLSPQRAQFSSVQFIEYYHLSAIIIVKVQSSTRASGSRRAPGHTSSPAAGLPVRGTRPAWRRIGIKGTEGMCQMVWYGMVWQMSVDDCWRTKRPTSHLFFFHDFEIAPTT